MPASSATRHYQRQQVALRAVVYSDVAVAWRLLDPNRLDATFPAFAAAVLEIIRGRRETSAALARHYIDVRRAGLPTPAPKLPTPPLDRTAALVSLRVTSVVTIKAATKRRVPIDRATRNALVRVMGAADKYVGDAGRELIRASIEQDPLAKGWVRVTLGTCDFCAEQASEHHVKAGSADFPRHDHCGCQPEPQYEQKLKPEAQYVDKISGMLKRGEVTEEQLRAALLDPNMKPLSKANIEAALDALEAERVNVAAEIAQRAADARAAVPTGSAAARVDIPQEALDALVPRGGWTTSTRNNTLAVLKQSPEGRQLLKTMDAFQSGGSTAIPRLRTDIEKYLIGDTAGLPQGRIDAIETFLSALGRSDAGGRSLYRGMSIPGSMDEVAARYAVGDDLDLSLASFSTDRKLAQEFTLKGAGQRVRGATKTPVFVEWVGEGKRALPIERLSKSRVFANEKEWVGAGRYKIEGIKRVKRNGVETLVLTIRQAGVW